MLAMANELLDAALGYAGQGVRVFPVWPVMKAPSGLACMCSKTIRCDSPGKHPMGNLVRRGLKDASADEKLIRHWWTSRPDANVGVDTERLVVIDIDPRHAGDRSLAELELLNGSLPPTWRAKTGGGGTHLWFAPPAGTVIRNSAGRLGAGLDIRAAGGYVIAPPSKHVSGGCYVWVNRGPLAPLPQWIITELAQPPTKSATPSTQWRELVTNAIAEGQRNQAVARLAGYLLRRYVDPIVALELLLVWNYIRCKPPLSDAEVRHTLNPIAARELARRTA
jgi:hypothetical protein